MATIQNRSRLIVTVKNRPDVTRFFPYNALDKVEAYVKELRSQGLRPAAKQGDDTWEVRVRDKGYPSQNITCHSRKEAETLVKKLDAERSTGLVRDYTKAHQVTFARLLLRYLREFKGKSARVIAYKVESWLEDSGEAGKSLLASYRAEQAAAGIKVRKASFQMRDTIRNLEWIAEHERASVVGDIDESTQSVELEITLDKQAASTALTATKVPMTEDVFQDESEMLFALVHSQSVPSLISGQNVNDVLVLFCADPASLAARNVPPVTESPEGFNAKMH